MNKDNGVKSLVAVLVVFALACTSSIFDIKWIADIIGIYYYVMGVLLLVGIPLAVIAMYLEEIDIPQKNIPLLLVGAVCSFSTAYIIGMPVWYLVYWVICETVAYCLYSHSNKQLKENK